MSTSSTPGSYQRWLAAIIAVLLPCAVAVLVMVAQWRGLQQQAPLEQAVVARRLVTGLGFTTSIVTPRSLAFAADLQHHPELRHGPLAVLPGALLYKLMPAAGDKPFVFSSMLAWLATLGLAVLGTRALFGRVPSLLAGLLLMLSPAFVALAISADGRTWVMPLLVTLWLVLAGPGSSSRKAIVAGVVLGLISLVCYAFVIPLLWVVLPVLARTGGVPPPRTGPDDVPAPAKPRLDLAAAGLAAVIALLVVAPWLVRNQRVAGTPLAPLNTYQVANYTNASPGRSIERRLLDPGATPAQFVAHHQRQLLLKSLAGLHNLAGGVGQLIDWPLLALFLAALLVPLAGERGRARGAAAKGWLLQAALLACCSQEFGLLSYWTPLLAVWGAWFLAERLANLYGDGQPLPPFVRQPGIARRLAVAALLLVLALPGLGPQIAGREPLTESPSAPNWLALDKLVPADGVIATDDPWTVAWKTNRTAVWLPQSTDDLRAVDGDGRLAAIYFSRGSLPGAMFAEAERAPWWSWAQVMPAGFLHFRAMDSRVEGERVLIVPR